MTEDKTRPFLLYYDARSEGSNHALDLPSFQIERVQDHQEAMLSLQHRKYTLILLVMDEPDERMLLLAQKQAVKSGPGIVALMDSEKLEQVRQNGNVDSIFLMENSVSGVILTQILRNLLVISRSFRKMTTNFSMQQNEIEDLKVIQRAKLVLVSSLGMSEAQAHRYIEKRAMDTGSKRRQIAETIISTYENK